MKICYKTSHDTAAIGKTDDTDSTYLTLSFEPRTDGALLLGGKIFTVKDGEAEIAMDALSDGEYTPRLESEGGIYTAEGFGKSGKVITLHPISDSMIRGLLVRCYELEDSVLMLKKNVKVLEDACHGHKIFDFERKET